MRGTSQRSVPRALALLPFAPLLHALAVGGAALSALPLGAGLAGGLAAFDRLNPGGWWGGGEYYQLVMARVQSKPEGFDGEKREEVHTHAAGPGVIMRVCRWWRMCSPTWSST